MAARTITDEELKQLEECRALVAVCKERLARIERHVLGGGPPPGTPARPPIARGHLRLVGKKAA
jgi:hypothetical protein